MKLISFISIGLVTACSTVASGTNASPYIYVETGEAETQPDMYLDTVKSDIFNIGVGYNFSSNLGAEMLYSGGFTSNESTENNLQTSATSVSSSIDKLDVLYFGVNYKVGNQYYAKMSGGYAYIDSQVKLHAKSRPCCFYDEIYTEDNSKNALFAGIGLGVKITEKISIETNYRTTINDNRFATLTLGAGYSFD